MANRIPLVVVAGNISQLPAADALTVPGTDIRVNGVTYTWPATGSGGVLANNGSNLLSWRPAREAVSGTVTTTDATPTTLISLALDDNTVYLVEGYVVARRTDAADRAGYYRNVVAYREAAGAATLQGTVDTSFTRESDATWDSTIIVSGNNLILQVTGRAGRTIDWLGQLHFLKVT